jgi:tRNA(Phe) wybutosine-synthesizing methylase Tyw3
MRQLIFLIFVLALSGLAGCAGEVGVKEERMKMLQKYEQCVDQAKKNKEKLKACEQNLKTVETRK